MAPVAPAVSAFTLILVTFASISQAYRYDPAYVDYNLNQNQTAIDPLDYWGEWTGHEYTPSPDNWRMPFYTIFLDRFVNGDPTNDNSNNTAFEHDINSNQIRHGGDLQGLIDTLDYIQGMGIEALYIAGSPFLNQPWGYDQYSPLDLTILDSHFGTINLWRKAINEIHARNMYVVLDNTFATLGDLVGFNGYLNTTAPFTLNEHKVQWKSNRHYWDFEFGNDYNATCDYPRFWNETGFPIDKSITAQMVGCYDSEFDQYGDTEAFGVFPDWRRQLSKFASVQDRLREWHPSVRAKIEHFYCNLIAQLDVDGYRYDKAIQSTPDAMGYMNDAMRTCAKRYGKKNFFLPGEITGGNDIGSIYVGRGRQPNQLPDNITKAVTLTSDSVSDYVIRDTKYGALDSGAFHYTTYRSLTRFLGMDGNLEAGYDAPINWIDQWNTFLLSNDLINSNTGEFDPRHMYGVTNQDVFRWPAITDGVQRQLLGHFVTSLLMPGIPLLLYGEEQAFYVLDNTASNYIYGRQAMSAATAWQIHGCYHLTSTQYYNFPLDNARNGCSDDTVSYDHRDPSAPVRNILRRMMQLRKAFPVLNDGYFLQQLSNQTHDVLFPGSSGVVTEIGLWSVLRSGFADAQNLTDETPVWLVYSNLNETKSYEFDCKDNDTALATTALIAPFDGGTTVKNLMAPYDQHVLDTSATTLGIGGSTKPNGCLSSLEMRPYGFGVYVPVDSWIAPEPMITKFTPGHDARIESKVAMGKKDNVDIALEFSAEMDCDAVSKSISFSSTTEDGSEPSVDLDSVRCSSITASRAPPALVGQIEGSWTWAATLNGVAHGVHRLTFRNASAASDQGTTNSVDHFLLRLGRADNPVVFPSANYSSTLLTSEGGNLKLHHSAAGADMYRYSTNFGSSFSDWLPYRGGVEKIQKQPWTGTSLQAWKGEHVRVEYFNRLGGSSDHVQEADVGSARRRFPNMWLNGPYNSYGYDAGLNNQVQLSDDNLWSINFMSEWSLKGTLAQLNIWGINPDGFPDQTAVYGDADGDSILDRLPPSSLSALVLNVTEPPPTPYLSWRFIINDGDLRFRLVPAGSQWLQLALYILLWIIPFLTATLSAWAYAQSFYQVKFNEVGIAPKGGWIPMRFRRQFQRLDDGNESLNEKRGLFYSMKSKTDLLTHRSHVAEAISDKRRTVLIATMEYDIEDWAIKIKIGGLGVMAQLMGKNLGHQDLIWVVPCVGGIDYPVDRVADPMTVTIMDVDYEVGVQYHTLRNITYVLLDAPVFRQQTKSEPYPARMDDMDSAIYYSAWNQCIAHALERFPIDLYHINDYHGTVAPLYLLPRTIPACLSLHNAEFQGLWPIRTPKEREEVCSVFNLPQEVVAKYVQFGEIFNLLHAGASYLRVNQQGFGAVGVSNKYGKRAFARYPIFWGLKKVQGLPNPDPSDTGEWDKKLPREEDLKIDNDFEKERLEHRIQAQEWAGLEKDPNAELFVFVGRWSMQKGVDLIADVFTAILEKPNVQLITIGPVIDLHGKFAALKLDQLMKLHPKRVCSKPVFTALPPYIFSGAEFALIPSRDEPFGLVAVEFGRKGALGVGARVGGLGQMPGWWYTVESITTPHLLKQFKHAISEAMSSSYKTRAMMRARSAKQRFPVAQWVEDLGILQSTSIRIYEKVRSHSRPASRVPSVANLQQSGLERTSRALEDSPYTIDDRTPSVPPLLLSRDGQYVQDIVLSRNFSRLRRDQLPPDASLGSNHGPGHVHIQDYNDGSAEPGLTAGHDFLPPVGKMNRGSIGRAVSSHGARHGLSGWDDDFDHGRRPSSGWDYGVDNESLMSMDDADINHQIPATPVRRHARNEYTTLGNGDSTQHRLSPPEYSPTLGTPSMPSTPRASTSDLPFPRIYSANDARKSTLSIGLVVGTKTNFNLQQVDPFFTDSNEAFYHEFEEKLKTLDGKNSETDNCIEEFLVESEKSWFNTRRNAKLGRFKTPTGSRRSSWEGPKSAFMPQGHSRNTTISSGPSHLGLGISNDDDDSITDDEYLLGKDYKPPTGIKKWIQIKVGDWPIYAFLLALGQIMAANSYQITLLTGEIGQTASKLYVVASIYLATSICWWLVFRRLASMVSLSLPFFMYGIAFMLIGIAQFSSGASRTWIQNSGTGLYAAASSSGYLFFALNFGDEGGAKLTSWMWRACLIQGSQQIYVCALWLWGSAFQKQTADGLTINSGGSFLGTWRVAAVTFPIAICLWIVGFALWYGLPAYYRQTPGTMPSFYRAVIRRKIVIWFFVTAIIQNFFLSAPYGRNWSFLFSSQYLSIWQVLLLAAFFFIGVWACFLTAFGYLSKSHSWILPLFAIGLGAPRWAQIWWGTSNIGLYLPWAGDAVAGALVSRALWLWLGVLDAVQGVGLGMIMLGTLTRMHVAFAVMASQVLGSLATIVARAVAPNRIGPGPISPDISGGVSTLWQAWFWIALSLNLLLCVGFYKFYRKEQLQKP